MTVDLGLDKATLERLRQQKAPLPEDEKLESLKKLIRWLAQRLPASEPPVWITKWGFGLGIGLALLVIIVVFGNLKSILAPLLEPLEGDSEAVMYANLMRMKMCLLVGGITAGIALMFLAIPLFLVGFNNPMVVESEKYPLKFLGVTPGALALLGGAVLIGFCCSQKFEITEPPVAAAQEQDGSGNETPQSPTEEENQNEPDKIVRRYLFSGEESAMLQSLKKDMSDANAVPLEFARTSSYFRVLYADLAAALKKQKNLTEEEQAAQVEYTRLAEAFLKMQEELEDDSDPRQVANDFIKAADGKYTIKAPNPKVERSDR